MNDFNSLTIALEDWFDKPLSDMPDNIRQRIENDIAPLPWDDMTPEQRREAAFQHDEQHDPAKKKKRQYWWDFFGQQETLKNQIAEWEATATSTVSDLATKESRLKELKEELARMEQQELQARGDDYPERKRLNGVGGEAPTAENPPVRYMPYFKAMKLLDERLNATPEELAAWIFSGPEQGGITAYTNTNELDPPPRFFYSYYTGAEDYIAPLMFCWFREDDVASFQPVERYITGQMLIERWGKQSHLKPKDFIIAKIHESRLSDTRPTFGLIRGSSGDDSSPPIESGLFSLSEVDAIEAEGFGITLVPPNEEKKSSPEIGSAEWRKQNAIAAANAKHDQPGGSRDKQRQIQEIWATGKYSTRDLCAEQECAALNMSFSAARKALRNVPNP